MTYLKHLLPVFAACFLLFTSCKKETRTEALPASEPPVLTNHTTAQLSATLQDKLSRLRATLPAGYKKRIAAKATFFAKADPLYPNLLRNALNGTTACNDNTLLNQWMRQQRSDWNNDVTEFALFTGMLEFPATEALLFENSSANQQFGLRGEYTHTITKTFKDLKRFWNIRTDDIVVVAMHGSILRDRKKLIRADEIYYGDSEADAARWADLILSLLKDVPQYRNGDHPFFTFNAIAQSTFNFVPYGTVPPKIVMGDGILQAFANVGYGNVAPQAILAHEYGHQVQFQLGIFGSSGDPKANRRIELMADAYAAYYLSHARGASMQWKRVQQFLQVFFNTGDCAFDNDSHHGTPLQRMAAAEWGYNVAASAHKQGHILTSQQFTALFDARLPQLVAH